MAPPDDPLLASVLDHLPLGIWIARAPSGELVLANRMFREIMGMDARPDVARGGYAEPYGIFGRDGRPYPEDRMPFVLALQARAIVTVDDIVIHRGDGTRVNIRAFARPVFDGDAITHVVIAFADVTAEMTAEAARRDSEERLRATQRLEAIGNLAAGVAHDFNNAMASIRVLAALLRHREADPERAEDLRRIEETTERAAELSRSLLTFGRRGIGRIARISVDDIARGVVDLVRRTFDRQIEVELDTGETRAWVDGDPVQLEQLFMNLLVNARDAMPDGGKVTIKIDVSGTEPWVTIEVEDTGPGIPVELRSRIFEPYFTTKKSAERPGTGLGLSTVYGVVQQHGGSIVVGDGAPHGARFVISLPGVTAGAPAPTRPPPTLRHGTGRVLLVEDDELVRRATRTLLEMLGYEVVEASDGLDALDVFRSHAPSIDAILLDVVMPRQNGRATLPALRAIREVPVLITTGSATRDEHEEWRALGAHALLAKPYDLGELSTVLADAIG